MDELTLWRVLGVGLCLLSLVSAGLDASTRASLLSKLGDASNIVLGDGSAAAKEDLTKNTVDFMVSAAAIQPYKDCVAKCRPLLTVTTTTLPEDVTTTTLCTYPCTYNNGQSYACCPNSFCDKNLGCIL
jgi:hypothetical protein